MRLQQRPEDGALRKVVIGHPRIICEHMFA